jgi:release factor glutamine methyltransferase
VRTDQAVVARLRAAGCVFAEEEAAILIASAAPGELDAMVARRADGEPLEQVVGWAEFAGLRVLVDPGVFVPRRRSEFLVDVAVLLAGGSQVVVELHAADLDPAAVACARRNVEPAGGHVYAGDLFAPLPGSLRGRAGVLICNAPYVPTTEIAFMPGEARDHEALMALDGGADGLAILRRAASDAGAWLAPGGVLLVETSERQAPLMAAVMAGAGLTAQVHEDDESGATVVTGVRPGDNA